MDELYRDQILEHYKRPHHFGRLDEFDLEFEDNNPFCGDEQRVFLKLDADGKVAEVQGLTVFGPPAGDERGGIISFDIEGVHAHDISEILDRHGVAVRAGHHCAQVLMQRLGVPATTRASFAVYNTRAEVDALVDGLLDARRVFDL